MVKLPLNIEPPLKCYPNEAHALGVVFTQDPYKCYPWLFNYYYSFKTRGAVPLEHLPYTGYFFEDTVFTTYSLLLPFNVASEKELYYIITNMITQGYYCHGVFNEKYVPGFGAHDNQYDFEHPFMLFGVDREAGCYLARGYVKGFLENVQVTVHDMYNAITKTQRDGVYLVFFKLNPAHNYDCFDVGKFQSSTREYLSPENDNTGVNALMTFIKDMRKFAENHKNIDVRAMHVLYEHHYVMLKRLEYMKSMKIINSDVVEPYAKIVETCKILKTLVLKFNATLDVRIYDRISEKINWIIEWDRELLINLKF